jgi:C-terminal processing protease CtpA/Prc
MKIVIIAVIVSSAAAFAAASWVYRADSPLEPTSRQAVTAFDAGLPVEARVAALEQAVSDERQARQWLQEEVLYLTEELELLSGGVDPLQQPEIDVEQPTEDSRSARREDYRRRYSEDGRIEALIEAGFLPSQASLIVRREAELQMDALQARYDAERSGDPVDYFRSRNAGNDALRGELGDADYERYLEANNRSTSISISSVIDSSPAQAAGLQPGDEIVRYDGERVFSMTDLTQQAIEGVPGQNVAVDIVRNGVPMQVVMPRGPVGISGGRRRQ